HVDDAAVEALMAYDWPGNIRELENVIERAVVLSDGPALTRDDLPPEVRRPPRRRGRPAVAVAAAALAPAPASRPPPAWDRPVGVGRLVAAEGLLADGGGAEQAAQPHRLDGGAGDEHQRALLLEPLVQDVHGPQVQGRRVALVGAGRPLEQVRDLDLGLAED